MRYNIWHDGDRDEDEVRLWWVEAEEQDSFLTVTLKVPLALAEGHVAEVVGDDDVVCERDYSAGGDLCCSGKEFKIDFEKTKSFLEENNGT